MRQEWTPREGLDFQGEDKVSRKSYTISLKKSHIILSNNECVLIWSRSEGGGYYSLWLGYKVIREKEDFNEPLWWYKSLWKTNCPFKYKLFFWLSIHNKVPVWDNLRIGEDPTDDPFTGRRKVSNTFSLTVNISRNFGE